MRSACRKPDSPLRHGGKVPALPPPSQSAHGGDSDPRPYDPAGYLNLRQKEAVAVTDLEIRNEKRPAPRPSHPARTRPRSIRFLLAAHRVFC